MKPLKHIGPLSCALPTPGHKQTRFAAQKPPSDPRLRPGLLTSVTQLKPSVSSRPAALRPQTSPLRPPQTIQKNAASLDSAKTGKVGNRLGPPAYRPNPVPRVLQPKPHGHQNKPDGIILPRPRVPEVQTRSPHKTVQRFSSRVIQAVKFYPNLHPGAVEPVDPSNIFKLNSFANQYRLHKVNSHGVNVPNQQYNFVRTREGEMLLHSRYRHPSIAEGKQVLYAGEIFFNNGQLQWWSNGSGHYQPFVDDAEQANLPMDSFFSYQQIIKGEHSKKKS